MADVSPSKLHRALIAIHEEVREEGSEFGFRLKPCDGVGVRSRTHFVNRSVHL
jgi:hypothetical protein